MRKLATESLHNILQNKPICWKKFTEASILVRRNRKSRQNITKNGNMHGKLRVQNQ